MTDRTAAGTDGGTAGGTAGHGSPGRRAAEALRRFAVALLRSFLLVMQAPLRVVVLCLVALSLLATVVGVGIYAVPAAVRTAAGLTLFGRLEARSWSGVAVERPEHPQVPVFSLRWDVAWRSATAVLAHPVTWRDLAWLACAGPLGALVGALGVAWVGVPLAFSVVLPLIWWFAGDEQLRPLIGSGGDAAGSAALGASVLLAGIWLAPRLVGLYTLLAPALLAPARTQVLTEQVQHLRRTRAETVDTQALQIRRIERDLHDGAQARLVTLALTLGEADRLLTEDHLDVESARHALARARQGSSQALQELRDLVRGIHPPVLADRGLGDAVRALALDSPLTVHVSGLLPGRAHAAVESAVYFTVAELLTNAAKHGQARRVHVVLEATGGTLRVTVTDDGTGGADPARGSGLTGIQRRMASLDGRTALHSPAGGPTVVTVEVPAAWPQPPL